MPSTLENRRRTQPASSPFKADHDLVKRVEVASKIREKYPDRVPVIVEKDPRPKCDAPDIDKKKFLVPADLTVGKFVYELRKHMAGLKPDRAIFVFVNDAMPPTSDTMSEVYRRAKDEDGFLYITYSGESTFG